MLVPDAESRRNVPAERLNTIALGGMVPRSDVRHTRLACQMRGLLRYLAAQIKVAACADRRFEIALRAAGTPADATYHAIGVAHQEWCSPQRGFDTRGKRMCGHRGRQITGTADLLLAEMQRRRQAEPAPQLCVVAQFGMRIKRQVVGQQVDLVREQQSKAAPTRTDHPHVVALPEKSMVHQNRIGAGRDCGLDQRQARGHTRDQAQNLSLSFHLHAVWAIIAKARRFEQLVQRFQNLCSSHSFPMLRHLWLIFAQSATVCLAAWFVVSTLKPDWIAKPPPAAPAVVAAAAGPWPAAPPVAGTDGHKPFSYSEAAALAMPAVVNIFTSKEVKLSQHPFMNDPLFRHFFGGDAGSKRGTRRASSLGSGVVVSSQGYVLTNFHVIESAEEIEVLLSDNRRAGAKIVGGDPETDLAVIKIDLPNLPTIVFGRPEAARVGDVVLAIGNPYGVGQTVTLGIVSALGRSQLGISTFENFIQTDAAINPGNSGGALVDVQGRLLGINTAIYSRSGGSAGIGFAIPANMARQVMDQIIANGTVTRGFIGIEPQDITPELAESFKLPKDRGVLIAGVVRNGPADRAGIKPGDVLVEVEGAAVRDAVGMLNLIAQLTPGNAGRLKLVRQGQAIEVSVTVGKRPRPQRKPRDESE